MLARPRSLWDELRTTAVAWQIDPASIASDTLRTTCLHWLSSDERARYERFGDGSARHEYLAAHALCRTSLSRCTGVDPAGWRFTHGAFGKPAIEAPVEFESLRFNLSHTDGLAICLVSRAGDVGVDVAHVSRAIDVEQMARHFATERERARLKVLPPARRIERFFEQWVLREAYLKGIGSGIAAYDERFSMTYDDVERVPPLGDWRFVFHRPSARHVAAAAIRRFDGSHPVEVRWLEADHRFVRLSERRPQDG